VIKIALKGFILMLLLVFNLFSQANLLTNPGAETGSMSSWVVTANGGDGWLVGSGGLPKSGTNYFATSYAWDVMNQKVDILAKGYTANQLDNNKPEIIFSQWLSTPYQNGSYFLTFKLLAADGITVLNSHSIGTQAAPINRDAAEDWIEQTYTFKNYSSGVRYSVIEVGGKDRSFWSGHYGPKFDDASIIVNAQIDNTPPAAPKNFIAKTGILGGVSFSWSGNTEPDFKQYSLYFKQVSAPVYTYAGGVMPKDTILNLGKNVSGNTYLQNGIAYAWYVTAVDSNSNGSLPSDVSIMISDSEAPPIPTNFTIIQSKTQLKTYNFKWTSNATTGADKLYQNAVYSGMDTPDFPIIILPPNVTEFTSGKHPFKYYYAIAAVDSFMNTSQLSNIVQLFDLDTLADVPKNPKVYPIAQAKINLTWELPTSTDKFLKYKIYENGNLKYNINNVNDLSMIINGVDKQNYSFTISHQDSFLNESPTTNAVSITADGTAPNKPLNFKLNSIGKKFIKIEWTQVTENDMASIKLYRDNILYKTLAKESIGFQDTLVVDAVVYKYQVSSMDIPGNESELTNPIHASPDGISPVKPVGLNVSFSNNKASLSWDKNQETDIRYYKLYYSTDVNLPKLKDSTSNTSINVLNLENNKTYYFKLKAEDSVGNISDYSSIVSGFYDSIIPTAPTKLNLLIESRKATLSWNKSPDADIKLYNVYYSGNSSPDVINYSTADSSIVILNLLNNKKYFFRIKAEDSTGNLSDYSSEISGLFDDIAPEEPTGLKILVEKNQIILNWNKNEEVDINYYALYYSTSSEPTELKGASTDTTTSILNLDNNIKYYFRLKAHDLTGNVSSYSETVSGLYDSSPPKKVSGLVISPGNTQIYLKWLQNEEDDLQSYELYTSSTDTTYVLDKDKESFLFNSLSNDIEYTFSIIAIDTAGNKSDTVFIVATPQCSLEVDLEIAASQVVNYPNPSNPNTIIQFKLPNTEFTTITVYDILGRELVVLYQDIAEKNKTYNVRFIGSYYPTGLYFYVVKQNKLTIVKKLMIVK